MGGVAGRAGAGGGAAPHRRRILTALRGVNVRGAPGGDTIPRPVTTQVSLIGAGPGDPGLLTILGARRIREADTILCDALVHQAVLDHARPDAEILVVGKRGGEDSTAQEEILHTMLLRARQGRRVVRVKGGDPMVFGRAAEEMAFLAEHGVPCEVVPGVTAALGASASARIPLTHRDLASSVAFVTATERPERVGTVHDWARLATATQTLVVYMGLRRLRETLATLLAHGRPSSTPAAVVAHATLPSQQVVAGTLADLADRVDLARLPSPALVIVGEVVDLRERLGSPGHLPLAGRKVLVTRAPEQAEGIVEALRREGAQVIELAALRFEEPDDPSLLQSSVRSLGARPPTVLAFSSANGVERFFAAMNREGLDARVLRGVTVASLGPATTEALQRNGIRADLVARRFIGEGLAEAVVAHLGERAAGARVLLPRAQEARDEAVELLREAGVDVEVVPAYRTVSALGGRGDALRASVASVDAVTFLSASAARHVCEALGDDAASCLRGRTVASIGPRTTEALRRRHVSVSVEAEEHSAEGLVAALCAHLQNHIEAP